MLIAIRTMDSTFIKFLANAFTKMYVCDRRCKEHDSDCDEQNVLHATSSRLELNQDRHVETVFRLSKVRSPPIDQ